ncbi:flavin reductase family protein [Gordonia sp. NPDC003376]
MSALLQPVPDRPDIDEMRRAYGSFPSGVTAVCGLLDGRPFGMAASSFTSVSMEPPLVSVCITNGSRTLALLGPGMRVGLSVLAHDQDRICRSLSGAGDRFADIDWTTDPSGSVFVEKATTWLDCSVHDLVPAGDHRIVLFRVHGHRVEDGSEPLVFHRSRFRSLVAG